MPVAALAVQENQRAQRRDIGGIGGHRGFQGSLRRRAVTQVALVPHGHGDQQFGALALGAGRGHQVLAVGQQLVPAIVNRGQAGQFRGHSVVVRILVQRRQEGVKGAVGIPQVGVEELRRADETTSSLRGVVDRACSLDEEGNQILPALLAEIGALQLAEGIHRGRDVVVDECLGVVGNQRLGKQTFLGITVDRKCKQDRRILPTNVVECCMT